MSNSLHKNGVLTVANIEINFIILIKLKAVFLWLGDILPTEGSIENMLLTTVTRYNANPLMKHLFGMDENPLQELIGLKLAAHLKSKEMQSFVCIDMNSESEKMLYGSSKYKSTLMTSLAKEIDELWSKMNEESHIVQAN